MPSSTDDPSTMEFIDNSPGDRLNLTYRPNGTGVWGYYPRCNHISARQRCSLHKKGKGESTESDKETCQSVDELHLCFSLKGSLRIQYSKGCTLSSCFWGGQSDKETLLVVGLCKFKLRFSGTSCSCSKVRISLLSHQLSCNIEPAKFLEIPPFPMVTFMLQLFSKLLAVRRHQKFDQQICNLAFLHHAIP